MSAKYKSPSFLLPNELNTSANTANDTGINSLYSIDFNQTSGYVISNEALITGNQSRSISVWAKSFVDFAGAYDNQVVFSLGTGSIGDKTKFAIKIRGSQKIQIDAKGYNVVFDSLYPGANWGSIDLNDHQWHHYVVTYATDDLKLYVDGTFIAGSTNYNSLVTQDGFLIGAWYRNGSFADYFLGEIDEVSVFNRVLNTTEIAALYDGTGSNKRPSNLIATDLNPIAYYPLGEQAQNTGYLDPNNPGSDISGSEWQFPNGVLQDYVMDFDGVNDFIDISNTATALQSSNTFTISFWANSNGSYPTLNYGFALIEGTSASNLFVILPYDYHSSTSYNDCRVWYNGTSIIQTGNTSLTGWNHFCYVQNGATDHKIYINGVSAGTSTTSKTLQSGLDNAGIGGISAGASAGYFNGQMSNVAIWNTAITDANQIANIYNNGSPQTTYTVTPQNWWKLNADSIYTPSAPNYTTAVQFDSTKSDDLGLGTMSTLATATEVTFSIWAKITKGAGSINWLYHDASGSIITKNQGFQQMQYEISLKGTSDQLRTAPLLNATFETWHHVAVTLDAVDAKLYLNGELQDTETVGTRTDLGVNAFLGVYSNTASVYALGGFLSNFTIFNSALSESQVSTLFNFGTPETTPSFSPVHYWKLTDINTGLNDVGSLASNNATRGAVTGSGPTTASTPVAHIPSWKIPSALTIPTINYTSSLFIDESAQDRIDLNCTISGSTITGDGINLATTNTIAFWLYNSPTESSAGPILGGPHSTTSGNNFGALIYAAGGGSTSGNYGSIGYWLTGQQAFGASAVAATQNGQWQHFAFVRNGSTVTLYIDGQTGSASDYQITLSIPANETIVYNIGEGINHSSGSWHADAYISNLQLFSTNLPATGSESIESLYNNGQPKDITGFSNIAAWYTLTDTTTTSGGGLHDNGSSNFPANNSGASKVDGNVLVPSFNIPINGVSTTLPSTALQQSDLQFDSPYSNYSLKFSTSQSIDTNFTLPASYTSYSYSFWYRSTAASLGTGDYYIISNFDSSNTNLSGTRGAVRFNNSTKMRIFGGDNTNYYLRQYEVGSSLLDQQWHNVIVTFTNTEVLLYIDGVSISAETTTNTPITGFAANRSYTIGQSGINSGYLINSKLDEFAIFNKKLTEAEILSIYNNGKPGDISTLSPTNWWRLGENAYFVNNDITLPNSISGAPNGVSSGTATSMLTADAPGTYANGIGTNLDIIDRVGDAPLSVANSQSYNMIPDDKIPYVPGYVGAQTTNAFEMTFDGTNYFDMGSSLNSTINGFANNFSVSCWIKADAGSGNVRRGIIGNYDGTKGFYIDLINSSANAFTIRTGYHSSATTYNIRDNTTTLVANGNTWYNIVATVSGNASGNVLVYVNGVLENGTVYFSTPTSYSVTTNLETAHVAHGSTRFSGQIDEVAIFDTALTADQVKFDLYKPTSTTTGKTADIANNPNLPTPVAWYRMGD